jgi:hypothetical protein
MTLRVNLNLEARQPNPMSTVALPSWNALGLIPPIDEQQPTSPERSPYAVSLTDFVLRFGQTQPRRVVLAGFLKYRSELHAAGLVSGFQWLDGSFLENVEVLEARAPNDIDVVTFFDLPADKSQLDLQQQFPELFPANRDAHQKLKTVYCVDAYVEHLGKVPSRLVRQASYWYSMWSHRRNQAWKGYVQIDLASNDDALATAQLENLACQGVTA